MLLMGGFQGRSLDLGRRWGGEDGREAGLDGEMRSTRVLLDGRDGKGKEGEVVPGERVAWDGSQVTGVVSSRALLWIFMHALRMLV